MNDNGEGSFNHSHSTKNIDENTPNRHEETVCTDADEFPRAVAKTAVAQICESVGFQSVQLSALQTLADIAIRYLCDTGKASQFYANLAGRTQSNALDVLCAVEDIHGGGLTHAHRGMATSDTHSELKRFIECSEELPFCKPVPHFPIRKKQALTPSFSQVGEKPPGGHIPPWLPAFPDVHTYKATPVWNERKVDPRVDKLEQAKQRRKAEDSLLSLWSRLRTTEASSSAKTTFNMNSPRAMNLWGMPFSEPEGPTKSVQTATSNGSKSSLPAQIENKNDGPVVLPSILEAFAPALEAATLSVQETIGTASAPGRGLSMSMKGMPPLIMPFDFGRRAKQRAVNARLSLGGKEKKRPLPELKDDEKDEKRKRAEQILAQGLEGPGMAPYDSWHGQ